MKVEILSASSDVRFAGYMNPTQGNDHVMIFREMTRWVNTPGYEPTMLCGFRFSPSWAGISRDSDHTMCSECRSFVTPVGVIIP